MSRGGARVGAGRKPAPEGAMRECKDGRVLVKEAGDWVRLPGVRSTVAQVEKIKGAGGENQSEREAYLAYRREYLRTWRRRRKAAACG